MSWQTAPEPVLIEADESTGGYWALGRHDDVRAVSRNAKLFCSGRGVTFEDAPEEMLEASQSFLAMDAPRHTELLTRAPGIEAGEPEPLVGTFINGIKRMPCSAGALGP